MAILSGHYIVPFFSDQVRFTPVRPVPVAREMVPATHEGLFFIPVRTADGKILAMEVIPVTEEDELAFPTRTADGKIALVKHCTDILCNSCDSSSLVAEYTITLDGF